MSPNTEINESKHRNKHKDLEPVKMYSLNILEQLDSWSQLLITNLINYHD